MSVLPHFLDDEGTGRIHIERNKKQVIEYFLPEVGLQTVTGEVRDLQPSFDPSFWILPAPRGLIYTTEVCIETLTKRQSATKLPVSFALSYVFLASPYVTPSVYRTRWNEWFNLGHAVVSCRHELFSRHFRRPEADGSTSWLLTSQHSAQRATFATDPGFRPDLVPLEAIAGDAASARRCWTLSTGRSIYCYWWCWCHGGARLQPLTPSQCYR